MAIRRMKYRAETFSGKNPVIYDGISQDTGESINKNFNAGGRPKWQKRKKNYAHPILDLTGTMRDKAESSTSRWAFSTSEYVLKIMSTFYAIFHQYGTKKLPERKFVLFQSTEIKKIQERFSKAFLRK